MANKKSMKGKGSYAEYQKRGAYTANKKAKLARHLKRHPNDDVSQADTAKSSRFGYKGTDKKFDSRQILQLRKRVKVDVKIAESKKKVTVEVTEVTEKQKRKPKHKPKGKKA